MKAKVLLLYALTPLALFTCHRWFGPDIWWHLAWGRSILAGHGLLPAFPTLLNNTPDLNVYWLCQIFLEVAFTLGGAALISCVFLLLWLGTGWAWAKAARLDEAGLWGPVFLLVFVFCVQLRLEYRPEGFSFLFLALILFHLTRPIRNLSLLCLLLEEALWTNSHGTFILGPFLGIAFLFSGQERVAKLRAFGVLALGSLIGPFGAQTWVHAFGLSQVFHQFGSGIEEFTPTYSYAWWYWPLPLFWIYLVFIAAVAVRLLLKRRDLFPALTALAGIAIGLSAFRFIPMFMIMSGPTLGTVAPAIKVRIRCERVVAAGLILFITALDLFICTGRYHIWRESGTTFGFGYEWAEYPIGATKFLKGLDFKGKIFHEPIDGGYLEYNLPEATIVCDEAYKDVASAEKYFFLSTDAAAFDAFDQLVDFDAALVTVANASLVRGLLNSSKWVVTYSDSHRILFMKSARFANLKKSLADGNHNPGEDLRRWSYRSQPALWMSLAHERGDQALQERLSREFSP